ncbi:MAG: efflux RND transporter permease subunit [Spirochaetaceae bacterium]|nr:MAG: efflux RND transporter permease subunit [Spirochaetaceae bacterium]
MTANLLRLVMERRAVFLLLVCVLAVVGLGAAFLLPIQLYPQTQRPRVLVRIPHAGYSAIDFSRRFGEDIEARFLSIDGVDSLSVEYQNDRSDFRITFDWQTDSEEARASVDSATSAVSALLPADLRDDYLVRFFAGENAGFLLVGLRSPSLGPERLHRMLLDGVASELNLVKDAEEVEIFNIEDLDVSIELRPYAMLDYGLGMRDVEDALRGAQLPEPVGSIEDNGRSFAVRYRRGVDSIFEIGDIIIDSPGNLQIRLQDIADVSFSYTLPSSILVVEGEPAVRINATPLEGGNVREMSQDILRILEQARLDGRLPADTELQFYVDPADYINRSIRNVVVAAALGAFLAMFIVFLTLGELRNTLLIGISLPATMVLSFILMYVFELSLNLISLGGIALAVGMVVDSSIVVMENIHRRYQEERDIPDNSTLKRVVLEAVDEVRIPMITSTLTTILVFLPIAFTAPLTNAILGDQAAAVIFALVFALLLALSLIPVLASLMYRPKSELAQDRAASAFSRFSARSMELLILAYRGTLSRILRRKLTAALVVCGAFALLAVTVLNIMPRIPREIISPPLSDRVIVFFRSNELTDRVRIVEEIVPQMETVVRETAGEDVEEIYALVTGGFNIMFINLRSTDVADKVLADLQQEFVSDNVFTYNVQMWDPAELPLPRTNDLQIRVRGDDELEAVVLLEQVRDLVSNTQLYARVNTAPPTGLSDELNMRIRREVMDAFPEYSSTALVDMVRRILRGTTPVEFEVDLQEVRVSAVFPDSAIQGRERLENFLISTRNGVVPLKHFFDFSEEQGVAGIAAEDGEQVFRLFAQMPRGSSNAERESAEREIRTLLESRIDVPPGGSIFFEDAQTELDEAIRSLFVALGASIVLIYLVVAFQFNSLWIPFVILVTVPLGFIGVLLSLFIFNSTLSLNSLLGTILLGGVVVNNAILMIDFYRRHQGEGRSNTEALVNAAALRFPPILITMLTTILGMLPLAIGLGEGSNIVQPLGIAVSGGLLVSTLFTLYVIPSILRLVEA